MIATSLKPQDNKQKWYLIDAKDKVLGRLAVKVAKILQGKTNQYYSPQWDMGDHVIVVNAKKVAVTGNKEFGKIYHRHTQHPGGIKSETVASIRAKDARRLIELAVKGMMPKGKLARAMQDKLHIYNDGEHPHVAQQPEVLA